MANIDYRQKADEDARDMLENFVDEIAEQARNGEVSDDINNDYHGGDSYHHETHVDKDYDLTEAAQLLDQLSQYEETDSGLWEGLEPRQAIACQAAYTYGQAVWEMWSGYISQLNDRFIGDIEQEGTREAVARLYVLLVSRWNADDKYQNNMNEEKALAQTAFNDIEEYEYPDFDAVLVFADWLSDHEKEYLATTIREAVALAEPEPEEEEEDDGEDASPEVESTESA